jgi:uncharacterized protein
MKSAARGPLIEVRHSPIHGYGVFALRRIRKGTRIIEYLGDRISHAVADARYEDKDPNDNHTFLFTVDKRTVIDAAVDGNDARFINHSCAPNCESETEKRRVFIDAIKTIEPGEELNYDYSIQRDDDDPPDVDQIYSCRCGAATCRGSMLEPRKAPRGRSPARGGAKPGSRKKVKAGARSKSKTGAGARPAGAAKRAGAGGRKARPGAAAKRGRDKRSARGKPARKGKGHERRARRTGR